MIKRVFYFTDYNKLFEDEEVKDTEGSSPTDTKKIEIYAPGDIVEYKTRKYDDDKKKDEQPDSIAQGEIKKVIRGGKKYRVYNKNIDREFTKFGEDILGKSSSKKDDDSGGGYDMGDEKLLEKIYSQKVYRFGTI